MAVKLLLAGIVVRASLPLLASRTLHLVAMSSTRRSCPVACADASCACALGRCVMRPAVARRAGAPARPSMALIRVKGTGSNANSLSKGVDVVVL